MDSCLNNTINIDFFFYIQIGTFRLQYYILNQGFKVQLIQKSSTQFLVFIIKNKIASLDSMDKQQLNNQDNELDIAFIADQSKQPGSDFLSFSQERSISGISFINAPNYTCYSINDPQINGLQSWPQERIQPFKLCPKRNCSIRQENESYEQEENTQKYTKKRLNQRMKIVNIKQNHSALSSSSNYNSYCLRKKKKQVSYNQNSSGGEEQSQRNQFQFLVSQIKERPITRSFKKMQLQKDLWE